MKTLLFDEVAKLINHSRVTHIDLDAYKQDKGKWAIYKGENKVPHFRYNFYILSLLADATKESISAASRFLADSKVTQIVYSPSLVKKFREEDIMKLLPDNIAGIRDTNRYLLSFIKDQMDSYIGKLLKDPIDDYVVPRFKTPSGFTCKNPDPLMLFLDGQKKEEAPGALGLLIAEPGQGKTYTSRYLINKLSKSGTIPIYISSPQWYSLHPEDLSSIWKTITHSFKYYESPLDWIEGCEEEFLNVTLKAGIFKVIFDGFDEYVLWNKGDVDANETIESLHRLVKESGASILVTSRTSFWQSNVDKEMLKDDPGQYEVYKIEPFDRNNASIYFMHKFKNDKSLVGRAIAIYDSLISTGAQDSGNFVGRGFILSLIADLVERSDNDVSSVKRDIPVVQWVMEALCEREVMRQKLPIDKSQQMTIFQEFAENVACGDDPTTDCLRDIMLACVDSIDDTQIKYLLGDPSNKRKGGKLADHPLIRKDPKKDHWEFVQEQIKYNLLAQQLLQYAEKSVSHLERLFARIKMNPTLINELAGSVVDSIFSRTDTANSKVVLAKLLEDIFSAGEHKMYSSDVVTERYLVTTIAMFAVNRLCPGSHGHKDKTAEFFSIIPGGKLSGLHFAGTISSMSFIGDKFFDCRFSQVTWANCDFDESTVFDKCTFYGGKTLNSKNIGRAQFVNVIGDADGNSFINSEKIQSGNKGYSKEDLKSDIEQLIKRFIPNEGIGFKVIYKDSLETGIFGRSKYKKVILEMAIGDVLEEHYVADAMSRRYQITNNARGPVLQYLSNGVFTGVLASFYQRLCDKIKL